MNYMIVHQPTLKECTNNDDEQNRIVSDWKFWIEELIVMGVPYKSIQLPNPVFDENDIDSMDLELHDNEMVKVLEELFPKRGLK